jgi:hypothetical protein
MATSSGWFPGDYSSKTDSVRYSTTLYVEEHLYAQEYYIVAGTMSPVYGNTRPGWFLGTLLSILNPLAVATARR